MLKNYVITCYRKLMRRKTFAAINIIGLSFSLAGALLIHLYVRNELRFDRFHQKADRIYRVYCAYANPGDAIEKFPYTPPNLTPAVNREIAEIEEAVRLFEVGRVIIKQEDKVFTETKVFSADSGFFKLFSGRFIAGNPATALKRPRSVVLSRSAADRYFGNAALALDKSLDINLYSEETYTVTGVVEDFPSNSHFHFNALLSIDYGRENLHPGNWLSHWPVTYVLLPKKTEPLVVEARLREITEKILNPIHKNRYGKSYEERKLAGGLQEYRLQPLADVHLFSAHMGEKGNILYVYIFIAIGVMLIFIASFNYINLSTARSAWEAKNAGIRKVLGATKSQLYKLFLTESVGVSLIAAVVAIVAAQVVLVLDNSLIRQSIPDKGLSLEVCLLLIALGLLVGLLSGIVPARLISAFQLVNVLKGQLAQGSKGSGLRQMLVVAQFLVSMGLIMCTFLISRQLTFMQDKALGFDKEHLIVIKNVDKLGNRKTTLKQALGAESFVINGSLCYGAVGEPSNSAAFTPVELIEQKRLDLVVGIPIYIGDKDYLNTLGANLLMGHAFPPDLAKENQQIILNREALRAVDWQDRKEEDLIGKIIDVNGLRYELAGIVEDYHFVSLHEKIGPMAILSHYYQEHEMLMLRIKPGTSGQAINRIQEHWRLLASEVPFEYSFVGEDLNRLYSSEQRLGVLFRSFAGLAIFIACLGLLGLAMFSAERSVKEIGIRKVLGATVYSIVFRLSQNMIKLILLAFSLATPLTWYLMDRWLENFAYKTAIGASTFLVPGGLTLLIAMFTISFQATKAALANPAESLRYE